MSAKLILANQSSEDDGNSSDVLELSELEVLVEDVGPTGEVGAGEVGAAGEVDEELDVLLDVLVEELAGLVVVLVEAGEVGAVVLVEVLVEVLVVLDDVVEELVALDVAEEPVLAGKSLLQEYEA